MKRTYTEEEKRAAVESAVADIAASFDARCAVGQHYDLPPARVLPVLRPHIRFHPLPQARAQLSALLRAEGWTVTRIGALLDRHHSTICHYLNHMAQ